jgi:hypothetical protein
MGEQGSKQYEHGIGGLSSAIVREDATTIASRSKDNKGRELIPLTPKILNLIDIIEHGKGKHAKLLTKHHT